MDVQLKFSTSKNFKFADWVFRIQSQAITYKIAKMLLDMPTSRAETSKEINTYSTQKTTWKLQLCWCTLWMLQKKYKTLSCGFSGSFTNVHTWPPPLNSDAVCAYLSSNCYAVEPFDTTPVFIILSLSAAYARPTLSRTNESILHVTESILAPNKQCSLHFGSRSNPSPLFSFLRLN